MSSATGNIVIGGTITADEGSVVSGNTVYLEDTSAPCITLTKGRNNEEEDTYSAITGNICRGGNIGILLQTPGFTNKAKSNACITGNTCTATIPLQINENWSDCLITGNMFPNGPIVDNGTNNTKANNVTGT